MTNPVPVLSDDALREIAAQPSHLINGLEGILLSPAERDSLCATVRALRAEREKAIGLLSPTIPRTDLCDAARQIVFAHALEKGNAEKLQEKHTQLAEVSGEWARLLDRIRLWSKCEDGYPLDEHINNIATQLAQVTQERDRAKQDAPKLSTALAKELKKQP